MSLRNLSYNVSNTLFEHMFGLVSNAKIKKDGKSNRQAEPMRRAVVRGYQIRCMALLYRRLRRASDHLVTIPHPLALLAAITRAATGKTARHYALYPFQIFAAKTRPPA